MGSTRFTPHGPLRRCDDNAKFIDAVKPSLTKAVKTLPPVLEAALICCAVLCVMDIQVNREP